METQGPHEKESNERITLFQMAETHRQSLIESNRFYLEQGKKKLLSQFEHMEQEANEAGERWLESRSAYFDHHRHDPSDFLDKAYDESIEYYRLLSEMRDQTRLSLLAGMFHEWDKKLRGWLVKEIGYWHPGEHVTQKVWSANFDEIAAFLDCMSLASQSSSYLKRLSAFRYVVNVYKHGDGLSFAAMKANHQEFLRNTLSEYIPMNIDWLDHTDLVVSDEHLDELSLAITVFWESIPKDVYDDSITTIPPWFAKAQAKDNKDA